MERETMNPRRWLCILLPLLTYAVCFGQVPTPLYVEPISAEVTDTWKCPTEDVGGWWYDAEKDYGPQSEVYWAVVSRADFVRFCGAASACQSGIYAYAMDTTARYSLTLINHEYCHMRGWRHGEWPGQYGSPFLRTR